MSDEIQIVLPPLGESVKEGTVARWLKLPGATVAEGETVVEVTTDKVDIEVPSPASGTISAVEVAEGATVPVGAVLGMVRAGVQEPAAEPADGGSPSLRKEGNRAGAGEEPVLAMHDVVLPPMGESVKEGTIAAWAVSPGAEVAEGETLVEVTTDKVDIEVPAPVAGRLVEQVAAAGSTVPVGAVIGRMAPSAGDKLPFAPAGSGPDLRQAGREAPESAPRSAGNAADTFAVDPAALAHLSPLARRRVAEEGIALSAIPGQGSGAVVRAADVSAAQSQPAAASPGPAVPLSADAVPLRGPYGALVDAMEASRSIPVATSFREMAVATLVSQRTALNSALRSAGLATLSYTHLVAWAIVSVAREFPDLAVRFERGPDGVPARVPAGVHLGIAVDVTRKDGNRFLMVPVVHDAAGMGPSQFFAEYNRLVEAARAGSLTSGDLQGASMTLTNPGGLGTTGSVPRLMVGQGVILALGALGLRPEFRHLSPEQASALGISPTMTVTSTYDHRVIQGAQSGEFLQRLEQRLDGAADFYGQLWKAFGLDQQSSADHPSGQALPASIATPATPSQSSPAGLRSAIAGAELLRSFRENGAYAARLDPLGSPPPGHPSLLPRNHGLDDAAMAGVPAQVLDCFLPGSTLASLLPGLRATYCGTAAFEVEQVASPEAREWLHRQIEAQLPRTTLSAEEKRWLLSELSSVEALEQYLRRQFLGEKTFSSEGLDVMIPMLEVMLGQAAAASMAHVVIGMSHRGRLATVAQVCNRPYDDIISLFEHSRSTADVASIELTGDVKYHLGADGVHVSPEGKRIHVSLLSNPSHLEAVDPVVEGWVRALQTVAAAGSGGPDRKAALPVLVHGDAAFAAQGIVSEVFNLAGLAGYGTGGTIHIIANNQIGFTTLPEDGRSTAFASDLAKGYGVPIFHVNADDVEACIKIARLAFDYRQRYGADVLIDLVGYRRFGHNETDEPNYTQPRMYEIIRSHPTARALYEEKLTAEAVVDREFSAQEMAAASTRLAAAHSRVSGMLNTSHGAASAEKGEGAAADGERKGDGKSGKGVAAVAAVLKPAERQELERLNAELASVPEGFHLNPKLVRQLERRKAAVAEDAIDWAGAEALALATLLCAGYPVRLTGQDTERGTFSQRHLTFHDFETGERWTPLAHLSSAAAVLELHNSPLSEVAAMGFEYGYSAARQNALVLWEAQFGDFANNAQLIIDQFIAAGRAKWGQPSRLALLLPHGAEGMGPEHSSGRLERFLQLAAGNEMRVANCSVAAQYYHLLRDQAAAADPRPLVVMTPKSLLRAPEVAATAKELSEGAFRPVLDGEIEPGRRSEVRRVILCSGKIFHELAKHLAGLGRSDISIVRLEQLAPFPMGELLEVLHSYTALEEVMWVQEEPRNMGGWQHVYTHLAAQLPFDVHLLYAGRPERAAPAEGYAEYFRAEQERILGEACNRTARSPGRAGDSKDARRARG